MTRHRSDATAWPAILDLHLDCRGPSTNARRLLQARVRAECRPLRYTIATRFEGSLVLVRVCRARRRTALRRAGSARPPRQAPRNTRQTWTARAALRRKPRDARARTAAP